MPGGRWGAGGARALGELNCNASKDCEGPVLFIRYGDAHSRVAAGVGGGGFSDMSERLKASLIDRGSGSRQRGMRHSALRRPKRKLLLFFLHEARDGRPGPSCKRQVCIRRSTSIPPSIHPSLDPLVLSVSGCFCSLVSAQLVLLLLLLLLLLPPPPPPLEAEKYSPCQSARSINRSPSLPFTRLARPHCASSSFPPQGTRTRPRPPPSRAPSLALLLLLTSLRCCAATVCPVSPC